MWPPLTKYKAVLVAGAFVAAAGSGWIANGWRMGKKLAAQESKYFQQRARRGEDYADTLVKAAATAGQTVRESQALLAQARKAKAAALADTRAHSPSGAQYGCLDTPLPEDYLETFRK